MRYTSWSSWPSLAALPIVFVAACTSPTQQTPPSASTSSSAAPAGSTAPSASAVSATSTARYVDLTHDLGAESLFWPTAEGFRLETVADGVTEGGFYYASNKYSGNEHGGTHLDAPIHFAEGRWTTNQIPLDRLIGGAVVVDVSAQSASNADYQVTIADLRAWERANGDLEADTIVLIRTDFSKRWPDAQRYLGTAERGAAAVAKLHFPGLHQEAATWLVDQRKVKAVGIDTASIDYGQSKEFESHRVLCGRNIPVFENLNALDQLPPRGAVVYALPMKIKGGSGGPLRAIAGIPIPAIPSQR
jgi:kynurenine formamidase